MVEKERGMAHRADEAVLRDESEPFADAVGAPAKVSSEEAEHDRIMAIAREVMRDHREVLAALAK